ncbi:MAG: MaoC family dehydratase N-terminal domain-containing protein, partial [Pseudomonadota bacterium]
MTVPAVTADDFAHWRGRTRTATDRVSERLVTAYTATLSPHLAPSEAAPLGLYWCLAPDVMMAQELGGDGHPRLGLVLPDVPFKRRMWAGGEVTFRGALPLGASVDKTSTIADIAFKTGRSGALCFVTVNHTYRVGEDTLIEERQDIVYREPLEDALDAPAPPPAPAWEDAGRWQVSPDPTLLFRYSALTFNGHRIHYDAPYATEVEGYDGLVVHGPLQATLILNLAASHLGRPPKRMAYRGKAPL